MAQSERGDFQPPRRGASWAKLAGREGPWRGWPNIKPRLGAAGPGASGPQRGPPPRLAVPFSYMVHIPQMGQTSLSESPLANRQAGAGRSPAFTLFNKRNNCPAHPPTWTTPDKPGQPGPSVSTRPPKVWPVAA
jgi:hypothetical protein